MTARASSPSRTPSNTKLSLTIDENFADPRLVSRSRQGTILTSPCLFLLQNGPYGSSTVLDTGAFCLSGYGGSLPPGASTSATTFYCSNLSYDVITYAGATDRTLRVYPFEQDAACMTAPALGYVTIETCRRPLDDSQRWNFVADNAGAILIQSVANQTFMTSQGGAAAMTLTSSGTAWYPYQPPGEGLS
jgi:hypothetical protein